MDCQVRVTGHGIYTAKIEAVRRIKSGVQVKVLCSDNDKRYAKKWRNLCRLKTANDELGDNMVNIGVQITEPGSHRS